MNLFCNDNLPKYAQVCDTNTIIHPEDNLTCYFNYTQLIQCKGSLGKDKDVLGMVISHISRN